jgi:chromosome segregation and condensation protein ScpB
MPGTSGREDWGAQAKVLRAVLLAADKGLTEEQLTERCEDLGAAEIEAAVEALLISGLLKLAEARLYPSGAATRFSRLRPL